MSRRNVTIGFSEVEFMRIQGAAALARTPISTYLKWLLQGSPVDGISKYMSVILASLEEIKIAIASLSASPPAQPSLSVMALDAVCTTCVSRMLAPDFNRGADLGTYR